MGSWISDLVNVVMGTAVTWGILVVSMLLVQKVADIDFPPLGEFLLKALSVVVPNMATLVTFFLLGPFFGSILNILIFVCVLAAVYDWDLLRALVVAIVVWVLRILLFVALLPPTYH